MVRAHLPARSVLGNRFGEGVVVPARSEFVGPTKEIAEVIGPASKGEAHEDPLETTAKAANAPIVLPEPGH